MTEFKLQDEGGVQPDIAPDAVPTDGDAAVPSTEEDNATATDDVAAPADGGEGGDVAPAADGGDAADAGAGDGGEEPTV